jgi:phenylalanine-4-hydroxylase
MSQAEVSQVLYANSEDDLTWARLMDAYIERIERHGCGPLIDGFRRLHFDPTRVERIPDLSRRTEAASGWRLKAVDSLFANERFAELLCSRIFPVAAEMRRPEEWAFAELPDLFHDALGHLPLLIHPAYRDFLAEYARVAALFRNSAPVTTCLTRLYWHTIEVGLVREAGALKIMGAAIATSDAECERSMSPEITRAPFDLERVIATDYSPFSLQPKYFVLDSVESLSKIAASIEDAVKSFAGAGRDES